MLSITNTLVTNLIAMIPMLTGIGGLLAWILPGHCLHSLEKLPPLQRAFRQCVGHVQAMMSALPGGLSALGVPTDCLRSLENWPPFHRAFRQSVGNPEAVCSFYDNARQQPDSNYALEQIAMSTSKGPGASKIINDAAYERTRENMSGSGQAVKSSSAVRDRFYVNLNIINSPSVHMLTFFKKLFSKDPKVMLELKLDDGRLYQERVRPEDYEERFEFLQRLFHQEKALAELNFIYCLVGNIVEERTDKTRNITIKGTKHFSPATKVYCYPPQWGDGYEKIKVIGLHRRSRRLFTIVMPSKHITNWRLKTVYHPLIIKEMNATGGWLNKESHKEDILTMASSLNRPKPWLGRFTPKTKTLQLFAGGQ